MTSLSINLASEPFHRDRPVLVAAVSLGVLLVALLAFEVSIVGSEHAALAENRSAVERAAAQAARLAGEQSRLEAALRRPENAEMLERSVFLNSLLVRKGISWTGLFGDLENVLPHNVRLISIRPQVDGLNRIQLEMIVGAQAPEPVIEMLKRLQNSPLFGATAVATFLPPTLAEPLYRYRVNVDYAQKL